MEYKVGDKLIFKCKGKDNIISRSGNYTYGKSYKILEINDMIYLAYNNSYDKDDFDSTKHEYYGFYVGNNENIWDYFFTKEEERKVKLEKINGL